MEEVVVELWPIGATPHGGPLEMRMPVLSADDLERTLSEIVRRLRKARSPSAIYVFGSYAYGSPRSHSRRRPERGR